jgi:hypothetical protein
MTKTTIGATPKLELIGESERRSPLISNRRQLMIISIEGPEKAGKSTLVEEILTGFEPDMSRVVKQSGRDGKDGFGYLHDFIAGLDSNTVDVWDRAWIGEYVYGRLLGQDRLFTTDPFLCEWIYGRLLEGRGGKFVLLPVNPFKLAELRDETDLPVNPIAEYDTFKNYAATWGYTVLENDYVGDEILYNAIDARRSVFVDVHKSPSTAYVGSRQPNLTFVGNSIQEFPFENRPFFDRVSAEYFRPYGARAMHHFGYATVESYEEAAAVEPALFKNVMTVGNRAKFFYPELPNAPYAPGDSAPINVVKFKTAVDKVLREIRRNAFR